jgi:hypothetical protein
VGGPFRAALNRHTCRARTTATSGLVASPRRRVRDCPRWPALSRPTRRCALALDLGPLVEARPEARPHPGTGRLSACQTGVRLAARRRIPVAQRRCTRHRGRTSSRAQRRRAAQGLRQLHRRDRRRSQRPHRERSRMTRHHRNITGTPRARLVDDQLNARSERVRALNRPVTVNPSRKLQRFESSTRHFQYRRPLSALSRRGRSRPTPAGVPLQRTPCRLRCRTVG